MIFISLFRQHKELAVWIFRIFKQWWGQRWSFEEAIGTHSVSTMSSNRFLRMRSPASICSPSVVWVGSTKHVLMGFGCMRVNSPCSLSKKHWPILPENGEQVTRSDSDWVSWQISVKHLNATNNNCNATHVYHVLSNLPLPPTPM